jgi:hypothetical protein
MYSLLDLELRQGGVGGKQWEPQLQQRRERGMEDSGASRERGRDEGGKGEGRKGKGGEAKEQSRREERRGRWRRKGGREWGEGRNPSRVLPGLWH